MADGKTTSQIQRDAQVSGGNDEAFAAQIEGMLKDLHTCLPGIIVSFDPVKQTAAVQPTIKRIFTERGAVNLPVCVDVPVAFPGGGDFFLTFPVKAGDECILLFSERAIDIWHEDGGTQPPAEYRLHDLSDGIALVGINSKPNQIPELNAADVELRTRTRDVRVTMKHDGTIENVNPIGNTVLSAAGKFTINAPGGFEVNAPTTLINSASSHVTGTALIDGATHVQNTLTVDLLITGAGGLAISGGSGAAVAGNMAITGGNVTADGIGLKTHKHGGVQTGGGQTGTPV